MRLPKSLKEGFGRVRNRKTTEMPTSQDAVNGAKSAAPRSDANVRWHKATNSDTVFVFVHGLFSDSTSCWSDTQGHFWPQIVACDRELGCPDVFLAGYYTEVDSGMYDIAQCATELFESIRLTPGFVPPLDYPNIVFVAHSLGGIVTRRMLEENAPRFGTKSVGLVLVASPSMGSRYAGAFREIASVYAHKTIEDLLPDSPALEDLDRRFRRLLRDKLIPNLTGTEATEHLGPLRWKWIPEIFRPVVDVKSASQYFGPSQIIPKTDHFSIAKPSGVDHPSHTFLRRYFLNHFRRLENPTRPTGANATVSIPADPKPALVLFDVYGPGCSDHYIKREVDDAFADCMRLGSTWLAGPSGCGKTTVVKAYLETIACSPLEITLSHHAGGLTRDVLIREIVETNNTIEAANGGARPYTFAEAVEILSRMRKSTCVVLFLDELPLDAMDDVGQVAILQFISSIIDATKKKAGPSVQFVVCSIGRPKLEAAGAKCADQISVLDVPTWDANDLARLVRHIQTALPQLAVSDAEAASIVQTANGSPRFVKNFFKRRLTTRRTAAETMKAMQLEPGGER